MTEKEFLKQYGEVKVVFYSYYKYTFSFIGSIDGKSIFVTIGGNSDDIYRLDITAGVEIAVKDLGIGINYGVVKDNDKIIAKYDN